jgi:hypothetical protein
MRAFLAAAAVAAAAWAYAGTPPATNAAMDPATETIEPVHAASRALLFGDRLLRRDALAALIARGRPDAAAAMILALRYRPEAKAELTAALAALTGGQGEDWFEWMLWQEAHPEIVPHPSFAPLKLEVLRRTDPAFLRLLNEHTVPELTIRLEEVAWGGVPVDGIPSLDRPKMVRAGEADYLDAGDLVFGIQIEGDARAYPLRILGWHEMMNDVVGGIPVALAYCTLCGAGILFETTAPILETEGGAEATAAGEAETVLSVDGPLTLATSGLLYRSNKLMYDRQTDSLWNQFTGEPVSGPLVGRGIALTIRPMVTTTWAAWQAEHPETTVLSVDTGHRRDYRSGVVYGDYFASEALMFPALADESRLAKKDLVFGIRDVAAARAWPIALFAEEAIVNDQIGERPIVLLGDAESRTVRAYERGPRTFVAADDGWLIDDAGMRWRIGEHALTGPTDGRLARLPGHVAYWFAWDGFLGARSTLYPDPAQQDRPGGDE